MIHTDFIPGQKKQTIIIWGFMYDVWYGAVFYSGTWGFSRRSTLIVIETCV